MNYFKVTYIGESPLTHEEITEIFFNDELLDAIEEKLGKSSIGGSYTPIDEEGNILSRKNNAQQDQTADDKMS